MCIRDRYGVRERKSVCAVGGGVGDGWYGVMVVIAVSSGGSSPCTEVEGSGQVVWVWSRLEADGGRASQRKACFILLLLLLLLPYLPTYLALAELHDVREHGEEGGAPDGLRE